MEQEKDDNGIPFKIDVNVYYTTQNEDDEKQVLIDYDAMQEEYDAKLEDLEDLLSKL